MIIHILHHHIWYLLCEIFPWSWVQLDKFDDSIWLQDKADVLEELFVALNTIKDVAAADEAIKVVRKGLGVSKERVKVADRKLWVFLAELEALEVID